MKKQIIVKAKLDKFFNNGYKDVRVITKDKKYTCFFEGKTYCYVIDDTGSQYAMNTDEYGPFGIYLYENFITLDEARDEKINEIINI